jgi:DNA-binding CsgD family transcriptional regulator
MWSHRLSWSSLSDGHHWLERALALEPGPSSARAKALWVDAWIVLLRGGEPAVAAPLLEECRELAKRLGDEGATACAIQITGFSALLTGDFARAITLLEQALAHHRAVGDRGRSWIALFQLSMASVLEGDPRSAALCAECLAMCEPENAQWSMSYSLWVAGLDRWRHGDLRKSITMMRDALRLKVPFNDHLGIAQCLEVLAWITAGQRQARRAAELLGAAHMVWRSIGTSLPGLGHLADPHDRCETRLREALGDEAFTEAYARGSGFTLDRAVAFALDERWAKDAEHPRTQPGTAPTLTRREQEIAELVAQGLSNKEIAGILVIAQRTAESHVEHILRKLGLTSRSQIAAWAAQRQAAS